jgi:hypothetical protein
LPILRLTLILLFSMVSLGAAGAEPEQLPGDSEITQEEAVETSAEAGTESWLGSHKSYVDTRIERASLWVDGFFTDPAYEAEQAYSQIRLRPEAFYRKEQGLEGRFRFRARLNLPNLGRRVSLVAGVDEDSDFDDTSDDQHDEAELGLQFFLKESSNWNTSISVGMRFNEFAFFAGPRFRYQNTIGEKGSYRFTQTVRWQTNQTWWLQSRLDLNRLISSRFHFRQTFDVRWRGERAEDEGWRTRISSFLTQRLSPESGLQYEFSTIFHTRPDTHVDEYRLSLRYRKQTKTQWLYYEIVPQLSWEDEFDYKFNPGIRFRLEFFYGKGTSREFWKRELEDTDEFRW